MTFVLELLVSLLIVAGGSFLLIGSIGMVKLPDLLTRLHAPTKATTLGVGGALAASMVFFAGLEGTLSIHEVLITAFLFMTAPLRACELFGHARRGGCEWVCDRRGGQMIYSA